MLNEIKLVQHNSRRTDQNYALFTNVHMPLNISPVASRLTYYLNIACPLQTLLADPVVVHWDQKCALTILYSQSTTLMHLPNIPAMLTTSVDIKPLIPNGSNSCHIVYQIKTQQRMDRLAMMPEFSTGLHKHRHHWERRSKTHLNQPYVQNLLDAQARVHGADLKRTLSAASVLYSQSEMINAKLRHFEFPYSLYMQRTR